MNWRIPRRPDWRQIGHHAKIETARAVTNLPEIIVRAGGSSLSV